MSNTLSTKLRGFVDGTDRSFLAKCFRASVSVISIPYSIIIRIRNKLYDYSLFREIHVGCKTVSVGNLTLGGVGKTPFISWMTNHCLELGLKPGLVSRGYKAKEQESLYANSPKTSPSTQKQSDNSQPIDQYQTLNDEALEQALRFPATPHFLGPNRVEVAAELLNQYPEVNILLLDDAFQHRRIARDVDILLLDALNPFGGERLVPSGFLREPLSGMNRADVVILNRADLIQPIEREKIRTRAKKIAPHALWAEITQRPRFVFHYEESADQICRQTLGFSTHKIDYKVWKNSPIASSRFVAFCGLGAPLGFQKNLEREGLDIKSFIAFPDHCIYTLEHYERLLVEAKQTNADAFITTMKDFVKLGAFFKRSNIPVYAIEIEVEFLSGQNSFEELLHQKLLSL